MALFNMIPTGNWQQKLRLISGLVLLTFAAFHFFNHALGLVSVEAMQQFQDWRHGVTRSDPGGLVLLLAIITHPTMALIKLARRSTLKMPLWEAIQIGLGISIPLYMLQHLAQTRIAFQFFGVEDDYNYILGGLWPDHAWQQSILLLIVWLHGCMGLHYWLRLSGTYRKIAIPLLALAVMLPVLGLAGFTVSGRQVGLEVAEKARKAQAYGNKSYSGGYGEEDGGYGDSDGYGEDEDPYGYGASKQTSSAKPSVSIDDVKQALPLVFYGLLALALGIFAGRRALQLRLPRLTVRYAGGHSARSVPGPTLLEISRSRKIPHASICGGRGRCSTCRVHVSAGCDSLPPPSAAEAATLARVKAGPNIRLACQIRPVADLAVSQMVPPITVPGQRDGYGSGEADGIERDMAVLFLDVRGFTAMSADKLPYDVVHILNHLFEAAGRAVTAQGGWIDKYMGDGMMAVFGRDCPVGEACARALNGARAIDLALDELNDKLAEEAGAPLRIGIGIHAGSLVLGRIGESKTAALTVIGRTVNTAARLEALTKQKGCQLIVSAEAARLAGLETADYQSAASPIRGLKEPLDIVMVKAARDLPVLSPPYQGSS